MVGQICVLFWTKYKVFVHSCLRERLLSLLQLILLILLTGRSNEARPLLICHFFEHLLFRFLLKVHCKQRY